MREALEKTWKDVLSSSFCRPGKPPEPMVFMIAIIKKMTTRLTSVAYQNFKNVASTNPKNENCNVVPHVSTLRPADAVSQTKH